MTTFQKIIKFLAVAFGIYLIAIIFGGILMGVGGLSFLTDRFGDRDEAGEQKAYTLSQDIDEIELEIGAVDCEIVKGESFALESNSSRLEIRDKGGRLTVTDNTNNPAAPVKLKLYIPERANIKRIDISQGAGDIRAESLVCSSLYLECGAGDVEIGEAVATVGAEIEGGVGKIEIGSGIINDLELDMGIGSLELTSRLKGECDIDLGIGDADITLIGEPSEYVVTYDDDDRVKGLTVVNIGKGIGSVKIDYAPIA